MGDSKKRTMYERIDDEFESRNVHFSDAMKARVAAQLKREFLDGRSGRPAERVSFWQRRIAIRLPVLLIPVSIVVVVMCVVLVESRGAGWQQPTDSIVVANGGSMYSLAQLAQGEGGQ
jgi:hypothetical protein